ncbi:MAG: glutamate synthase large subunit, partial [Candidatus Marinimicrobia bacterium]|nr:glutamate synthase large subunit [Candidatus Neomarinimicrobiota bacterium]
SGEELAVGMVFTSKKGLTVLNKHFPDLAAGYGFRYLGHRSVPVNLEALGDLARSSCPEIIQLFLACPAGLPRPAESQLFLLRQAFLKRYGNGEETFFCSLSTKTIVYKGLMKAEQLDHFYLDLIDPDYIARVALFHERYSTNTIPNWAMAQPFRLLAHNGEINTIKGNRLWMRAREMELGSDFWGAELENLKPITSLTGSDSFSLDNALEFLMRSGRGMFRSLMMLIPEPYADNYLMERPLKDFYMFHENLMEAWDGPAAVVVTDGNFIGAKMDRNGLRPLRYTVTRDGLVIMASEAGVMDVAPDNLLFHHHMTAGEIFSMALDGRGMMENDEIKRLVASRAPYSKLLDENLKIIRRGDPEEEFGEFPEPVDRQGIRQRLALGWDREDLNRYIIPMSRSGREPVGSMGDDTPPAVLSSQPGRMYDYFKHAFAQVTNPPIDPIRERLNISLYNYLGSEENLLEPKPPTFQGALRIDSPVLSTRELQVLKDNPIWFPYREYRAILPAGGDLAQRLEELAAECEEAVLAGCKLLLISDENLQPGELPIPMPLLVSSLHHHLLLKRVRSKASIICLVGDVVEDHHVACLIALGASAVYPYLAYQAIREQFADDDWPEKMSNYRQSLDKGLVKIMAKSGIATHTSYHGSMLLHAIGLSTEFLDRYFPSIECRTGGIGLKQITQQLLERSERAFTATDPQLAEQGRFRYRKNGERHGFSPAVFGAIHRSALDSYQAAVSPENGPIYLRDLLALRKVQAIPLEQVEPVGRILPRFGSGAMSFGAISEEVHRTLASGMHLISGRSSTGEGGEQPDRYAPTNPDKSVNCTIKQIASGRFGVTTEYLAAAREIQIKIAQGAKPGEGGQLPGHKVTVGIATVRKSTPGVPLISPPPHHDIYSIEDIAQLIYDLKQVNPRSSVSVKLVAQPGVGTIACGVVKGGADIVLISGSDGGTGASPLGSLKHTGLPWELGLAEAHQALTANGLRSRVTLRVDGGLKNGLDIVMATLLGAEEYDFGTALLVALGCVMARQCHLNTCPKGIATQDEKLRRRFEGSPQDVARYLTGVAEEVRQIISSLGSYALKDLVGRTDLLMYNRHHKKLIKEQGIDLDAIMNPAAPRGLPLESEVKLKPAAPRGGKNLDEDILSEVRPAIMTHEQVVVHRKITNTDRAVGTRISGELAFLYGKGNFTGNIQVRLRGIAGQSFGAFLTDGVELRLRGVANDYVGKGLSGGVISIRFEKAIREQHPSQTIIGNVALYGATGGTLFIGGKAGERFAVRNSGAVAVVEGVGNHCCEYMTRGTVLVLGEFGRNFGAGMSGGVAFIYCPDRDRLQGLNKEFVRTTAPSTSDESLILRLLRRHKFHTRSVIAGQLIDEWDIAKEAIIKVVPLALDIIDYEKIYNQQVAVRMGILLNE